MTLAGQVATCPYNAASESTFIDLCNSGEQKPILEKYYQSHNFYEAGCSWVGMRRDLSCLHYQSLFVSFKKIH